jgi:multidrug resistance efflux pump
MMNLASAVTLSDYFRLNPRLVITDLGGKGVAVYVPPNSSPLRFESASWLEISALAELQLTESQLQQRLNAIPIGYENFDHYFEWLLSKQILLRLEAASEIESAPINFRSAWKDDSAQGSLHQSSDSGESSSIYLFTLNPIWPASIRAILLHLFRIQIWIAAPMLLIVLIYLGFFLFAPAPSALKLLGIGLEMSPDVDILTRIIVGLLSVNILSTFFTWLAQSVTGLGDGVVVLRFLFGFIPRFGINTYNGAAMHSSEWSRESDWALFCISQPLLTRLGLASSLIVLIASGRLHSGLGGGFLHTIATNILQISLFTGLVLALPFRISPGYRLMILLTDLPPSTLGQSVKHFYAILDAIVHCLRGRDRSSRQVFRSYLTSWRDVGLFSFAVVFFVLITVKFLLVILIAIPTLSKALPEVLGGASELIFLLILLALLFRFVSTSILPKLMNLKSKRVAYAPSEIDSLDSLQTNISQGSREVHLRSQQRNLLLFLLIVVIFIFPINRTVTGSVVVSTERDLTVRAPADVRITKILQQGPSTKVLPQGTLLIELQSQQLDSNLFQATVTLGQLVNKLTTLNEQSESEKQVLAEIRSSLKISKQASQVLDDQLETLKKLTREGASSEKMVQDVLLKSYEIQTDEQQKLQQLLLLQASLGTTELKMNSLRQEIEQSTAWIESLQQEKRQLSVEMPFDGLITSSTTGLMWSFVPKGDSLLELKEGSLNVVNVLIPDHDRSLINIDQKAEVRLYAEPNQPLSAAVQSIRPSGDLVDEKVFFQASLRLSKPLSPQLLQSSGAARINSGMTNLLQLLIDSLGRFILVDFWSWTP